MKISLERNHRSACLYLRILAVDGLRTGDGILWTSYYKELHWNLRNFITLVALETLSWILR